MGLLRRLSDPARRARCPTDTLPDGQSANPDPPDTSSRDTGARDGSASAASSAPAAAPLTLQSPHLDLASPAGQYVLELSHPATAVLVGHLLRLKEALEKVRRVATRARPSRRPWERRGGGELLLRLEEKTAMYGD